MAKKDKTILKRTWKYFSAIKEKCNNFLRDLPKSVYVKYFLILMVIYCVALLPLFRSNYNYIDDVGRVAEGYQFHFSRYISDFLSTIIHDGSILADISPFTQIIAVVFLSLASVLAIKLLTKQNSKDKVNLWYVIASLPIGLSPYFLENISYKFDAPYMALSILASIFPFVFYNNGRNPIKYIGVSFLSIIVVCTTYQSSTGIFPAMTILLALVMYIKSEKTKDIGLFVLYSAISYITAILLFKYILMEPTFDYVDSSLIGINNLVPGTIKHLIEYVKYIYHDFNLRWLIAFGIVIVGSIITVVIKSERNKFASLIIASVAIVAVMLLSFGVYPLMKKPIFAPRAMYGFFTNLSLLAIICVEYKNNYLLKICSLYLTYAFIILSMAYGNALYEQQNYVEYRSILIANDIIESVSDIDKPIELHFSGNAGYSPVISKLLNDKYPVLKRLVPIKLREKWVWGSSEFNYGYYLLNNVRVETSEINSDEMELVKATRLHDIYRNGDVVLVEIK